MSEDQKRAFLASGDLLSISEAARLTPYSAGYLGLRVRRGKIKAVKVGYSWLTTKSAVLEYVAEQKHKHQNKVKELTQTEALVRWGRSQAPIPFGIGQAPVPFGTGRAGFAKLKVLLMMAAVAWTASIFGIAGVKASQLPQTQTPNWVISISSIKTLPQLWADVFSLPAEQIQSLASNFISDCQAPYIAAAQVLKPALALQKQQLIVAYNNLASRASNSLNNTLSQLAAFSPSSVTTNSLPKAPPLRVAIKPHAPGQVLGISTTAANPPSLDQQIQTILNQYLAEGKFKGPQGPKGDNGFNGTTTVISNNSGTTYAPITYYPPNPANNFTGGSVLGASNLSSNSFSTNQANVGSSLTVSGNTNLQGNTTLATTTIADLAITGTSTFNDILPQNAGSVTAGIVKETVDPNAAYDASLSIGSDGFARISYFVDSGTYPLNFLRCTNTDCSSPVITTVATSTEEGYGGSYMSTLGSDGFARIVYMDANDNLQFVRCLDQDCATHITNPIDTNSANYPGYYGSMIQMGPDGFPRIVYVDYYNYQDGISYDFHFVRCTDADCTSPINTDFDREQWSYGGPSFAIGPDGNARIVFNDYGNDYNLKLMRCTDEDCTASTTVITTIDSNSANYPGYMGTMIRIGSDGFPRIAYANYDSNYTLHFLQCTDTDCTSPILSSLPNTYDDTYDGFGMDLRSGNLASISYQADDYSLHIVSCTDESCSTYNDVLVDPTEYAMYYGGSLVIGPDNLPRIVYDDYGTNVELARLSTLDGNQAISGSTLGTNSSPFGQINAEQLNINGQPVNPSDWLTSGTSTSITIGNVGIGTINPATKLEVVDPNGAYNTLDNALELYAGGTGASGPAMTFNDYYGLGNYPNWQLGQIGVASNGIGGSWAGDLHILLNNGNSATSTTERLTILGASGNVGIGTTSPSSKLQVNGSALFGSSGNTTGTILFANSANSYTTTLQSSTTQASNLTFTLPPTGGSTGQVLSTDGNGYMSWINQSTGATTTINGYSGPAFTFATGTATGLNLNITGTGSTITFAPQLQSGYNIPLTASSSNWTTAYNIINASSTNWNNFYNSPASFFNAGSNIVLSGTSTIAVSANPTFTTVNGISLSGTGSLVIGTTTPGHELTLSGGAYSDGTTWQTVSDANLKTNFASVTPADILQKIANLPITQWNYKTDPSTTIHIGPTAQDFYASFNLGGSEGKTSIDSLDSANVALLGIQALNQKITALQGSLTNQATTSNLTVYSPSNFSGDSVGEAEILAGSTSVRVTFSQAYEYQPIVTATPIDFDGKWKLTDINSTGFTIEYSDTQPLISNLQFNWHSFASPAEQLTVSDGTTQNIVLVVANPAPQAPQTLSSGGGQVLGVVDNSESSTSTEATTTDVSDASSTPSGTPDLLAGDSVVQSTTTPDVDSSTPTTTPPVEVQAPPDNTSTSSPSGDANDNGQTPDNSASASSSPAN